MKVALAISLATCVLLPSCATKPLPPPRVARPCLAAPVPERSKMLFITEPEEITYADEEGARHMGMRLTVDPGSMVKFFGYIEALELAAHAAEACVAK